MAEPIYDTTMEDLWSRLPDHFRRMDALNDWQLKKYLNVIASQLQATDDLIERLDYDSVNAGGTGFETSDLVDPDTADARWLPWLGQLFGVYVRGKGQESDRDQVIQAASGFNAGTPAAIEAAAKDVLVGSKFAKVYKRTTNSGVGTFWDLLLVTIDSETLKNLYPEIQATVAETVTWNITGVGKTTSTKIAKTDKNIYNKSALETTFSPATGTFNYAAASTYKAGPVTPTDWYQTMLTVWNDSGATYTGTIGISYYNSGGTFISKVTAPISVTGTPTQFLVGSNAPASSAFLSTDIALTNVSGSDKIHLAQLAARHETTDLWVPKTADPVQAVIDKGAKPAGFKLWYGGATSSWDDITTQFPNWNALEGAGTWENIEQTSN